MKRACSFFAVPAPTLMSYILLAGAAPIASAQSDPGLFSEVINVDGPDPFSDQFILELSGDRQLNLFDGGVLPPLSFFGPSNPGLTPTEANIFGGSARIVEINTGTEANILGGAVGVLRAIDRSVATISGGTIGELDAGRESRARITNGAVGRLELERGSTAQIDGGIVGGVMVGTDSTLDITDGHFQDISTLPLGANEIRLSFTNSNATISGGIFDIPISVGTASSLTVSGGRFNSSIGGSATGSQLTLIGGEFAADGVLNSPSTPGDLAGTRVLTGTLEDGSIIIITDDVIAGTTLVQADLPALDLSPIVVDSGAAPGSGLRPGQSLTLRDSGTIGEHYRAANATLNIEGGVVRRDLRAAYTDTLITGGEIESFTALGGTVTVRDGELGSVSISQRAVAKLSGGVFQSVGSSSDATVEISNAAVTFATNNSGLMHVISGDLDRLGVGARSSFPNAPLSTTDFSGGSITGDQSVVNIYSGGVLNLSGGQFNPSQLTIYDGGILNLTVLELSIDGQAVDLVADETLVIDVRGESLLEAILADGSSFSFELNELEIDPTRPPFFPFLTESGLGPDAVLTATLVPEPGTAVALLGFFAGTAMRRRRA